MPTVSNSDFEDINSPTEFKYHKPKNESESSQQKVKESTHFINTETEDDKMLPTVQIDVLESIETMQPQVDDNDTKQLESQSNIKKASKKVTFDYEQTITIEYNENDLITHLTVYDVDYTQIKFKPKIVKNYKNISKIGLIPCISPEFTKHLKLHTKTVPKLSNIANVHKKITTTNNSNSSRTTSVKRLTNMKDKRTNTSVNRGYKGNNSIKKGTKGRNSLNTSMNK
jgi:hypothetical protein